MENQLRSLLDKIYELEGLVYLSLKRDHLLDELVSLIARKGEEVSTLCAELKSDENSGDSGSENKEISDSLLYSGINESEEYSIEDLEPEDNDPSSSNSGSLDSIAQALSAIKSITEKERSDFEQVSSEEIPEEYSEVESEEDTEVDIMEEDEDQEEFLDEPDEGTPDEGTEAGPVQEDHKVESRGKLVFSINDRFRFKRDLFDNSDVEFNNTLALVASMENYDEAEDYFLNEQGWNPTDVNVGLFLNILKRYFG